MGEIATESDESYRARIINAYGMWGAFCSVVFESKGSALDDCGRSIGVERESAPVAPEGEESGE